MTSTPWSQSSELEKSLAVLFIYLGPFALTEKTRALTPSQLSEARCHPALSINTGTLQDRTGCNSIFTADPPSIANCSWLYQSMVKGKSRQVQVTADYSLLRVLLIKPAAITKELAIWQPIFFRISMSGIHCRWLQG
jgi:hypothetical protein